MLRRAYIWKIPLSKCSVALTMGNTQAHLYSVNVSALFSKQECTESTSIAVQSKVEAYAEESIHLENSPV